MSDTGQPQNRSEAGDRAALRLLNGRWAPGNRANPGGRPKGFMAQIRAQTRDGSDLIAFMVRVFRGKVKKARLEDRMAAATWLADRGFGKPVQLQYVSSGDQVRDSVVIYIPDNGRNREALGAAPIPPED